MKKRLHTSFVKFIDEKYNKESQDFPEEEETNYRKDISDEYDEIMDYGDEENETVENDGESIDDLITQYLSLVKKYKIQADGNILNERK